MFQHMLLSNFGMFVCDLELVAHYKMFFKTTTGFTTGQAVYLYIVWSTEKYERSRPLTH